MTYLIGTELGYVMGMRRTLLALAMLALPLTGWAQGTTENQQATFRSGVDLVTVSATVRDGKGRLVKDLTRRDFEITDRGEKRAINEFRSDRAPLSLAILFDELIQPALQALDSRPEPPGPGRRTGRQQSNRNSNGHAGQGARRERRIHLWLAGFD